MLVCHCHRITDRDINACLAGGCRSAAEVARVCRAGTSCGGCMPAVKDLVRAGQEATQSGTQGSGTVQLQLSGGSRIYR
ncbi:MAG TPA: (2Fe-2S)-binding protein [Polyangiaceae bacterium]|nr:(2Fe-2S)-binding protein [Polyangiaceae bacterium]